jgi:hypothetical protein
LANNIGRREQDKLELNAIRRCSEECYFFKSGGEGCTYFKKNQVKYGETCMYDLVHLKSYSDAFADGDLEFVKRDASGITAMVMMQIRRMLEQVNLEGVTVQEPILDARGQAVWIPDPAAPPPQPGQQRQMIVAMRIKDHPLIARSIQLARSIGINLNEFKLTPKSADEKRAVAGHIIAENPEDIKQVMKDRKVIEDKWLIAVEKGNERVKQDPVYQKLLADGEIVE